MKTKTNELTGPALDWAVAKCEDEEVRLVKGQLETRWTENGWKPSTDWSQGGPIIEREGISTILCAGGLGEPRSYWVATTASQSWDRGYGPYHEQDEEQSIQLYRSGTFTGPTPLIAAMRCFVASKLGDEVEVPDGLV